MKNDSHFFGDVFRSHGYRWVIVAFIKFNSLLSADDTSATIFFVGYW